jgi:PAS domain S-box-containing protein
VIAGLIVSDTATIRRELVRCAQVAADDVGASTRSSRLPTMAWDLGPNSRRAGCGIGGSRDGGHHGRPEQHVKTLVTPTGHERTFDPDEIIVSKTDLTGHITYANDVFLRVAALDERDVIGQPHSIIRHPDMPKVVFRLLWDEIQAGREIFAYVVNLAADGAHYWVFAHVTPTFARGEIIGYHSNRRVPDRHAVDQISKIYAVLLDAERPHSRPSEAMAASNTVLEQALADRSQTYDEFVWSLAGSTS